MGVRIILKWILERWHMVVWTGLIWLRIGSRGGLFWFSEVRQLGNPACLHHWPISKEVLMNRLTPRQPMADELQNIWKEAALAIKLICRRLSGQTEANANDLSEDVLSPSRASKRECTAVAENPTDAVRIYSSSLYHFSPWP
jgi:hypothetical protein